MIRYVCASYDVTDVGYEAVGVGDINGDGYDDVALANTSADDTESLTVAVGAPATGCRER